MTQRTSPTALDVRDRRILVTGDTGFKGAWLCAWLKQAGADVHGIGLPPETPEALFHKLQLAKSIRHVNCDIRDQDRLHEVVHATRPELIFHLAAQALVLRSYQDPLATWQTNVNGTLNLLEAARALGQRMTVIVATSDKVYQNREWEFAYREEDRLGGRDPYSASKAACELAVAAWRSSFGSDEGVTVATVRAGNVIGGGDMGEKRIVPDCFRAWNRGEAVELRHPNATRPWQHVLDALSGYVAMAAEAQSGRRIPEACNFGPTTDGKRTVEALVRVLADLRPDRRWRVAQTSDKHEARLLALSIDRAREQLGWSPRLSFAQGIEWTNEVYETEKSGVGAVVERQLQDFERLGSPVFTR